MLCVVIKSTEVEESQQLENSEGTEAAGLFADQEQQLTRSSSTSDIADQIPSDFFQGNFNKIQRYCVFQEVLTLVQPHKCCSYFGFQLSSKMFFYLIFLVTV